MGKIINTNIYFLNKEKNWNNQYYSYPQEYKSSAISGILANNNNKKILSNISKKKHIEKNKVISKLSHSIIEKKTNLGKYQILFNYTSKSKLKKPIIKKYKLNTSFLINQRGFFNINRKNKIIALNNKKKKSVVLHKDLYYDTNYNIVRFSNDFLLNKNNIYSSLLTKKLKNKYYYIKNQSNIYAVPYLNTKLVTKSRIFRKIKKVNNLSVTTDNYKYKIYNFLLLYKYFNYKPINKNIISIIISNMNSLLHSTINKLVTEQYSAAQIVNTVLLLFKITRNNQITKSSNYLKNYYSIQNNVFYTLFYTYYKKLENLKLLSVYKLHKQIQKTEEGRLLFKIAKIYRFFKYSRNVLRSNIENIQYNFVLKNKINNSKLTSNSYLFNNRINYYNTNNYLVNSITESIQNKIKLTETKRRNIQNRLLNTEKQLTSNNFKYNLINHIKKRLIYRNSSRNIIKNRINKFVNSGIVQRNAYISNIDNNNSSTQFAQAKTINSKFIYNLILKRFLRKKRKIKFYRIKKIARKIYQHYFEKNPYLKGFKIECKGRPFGSRKKVVLVIKYGNLNIHNLNSKIDHFSGELLNKYGLTNIKIWVNYDNKIFFRKTDSLIEKSKFNTLVDNVNRMLQINTELLQLKRKQVYLSMYEDHKFK